MGSRATQPRGQWDPRTITGGNDSNGSETQPNGTITKWGKFTGKADNAACTFPVAFPNACFQVIVCNALNDNWTAETASYNLSAASFNLSWGGTHTGDIRYIAIGR